MILEADGDPWHWTREVRRLKDSENGEMELLKAHFIVNYLLTC